MALKSRFVTHRSQEKGHNVSHRATQEGTRAHQREEVRERHAQETLSLWAGKSKAWQASLEFAIVNNFSGVWGIRETVPSFLVPDLGITKVRNYCPKYEGPTEEMEAVGLGIS